MSAKWDIVVVGKRESIKLRGAFEGVRKMPSPRRRAKMERQGRNKLSARRRPSSSTIYSRPRRRRRLHRAKAAGESPGRPTSDTTANQTNRRRRIHYRNSCSIVIQPPATALLNLPTRSFPSSSHHALRLRRIPLNNPPTALT